MLPPDLERQLRRLVTVFLEENQKMNLSAFRTDEQCWYGNILDSIAALDLPQVSTAKTMIDVGTGGGFPLLPLAIALPGARLVGIDSVQKKVEAVGRMAHALRLTNEAVNVGRAEELGRQAAYREQFDVVTSRAVAEINVLLEYTAPFCKVGGHIILWKSLNIDQELTDSLLARAELSTHLVHQHTYELPENWGRRQLLVFEKAAALSERYPREVGVPKKYPLS